LKSYIIKIILFFFLVLSVFLSNIIFEKYQVYINSKISNIAPLALKKYYYKYRSKNNDFPHLKLIIPDAGYDELKKNRLTALHNENGKSLLTKSIRKYVDSKLIYNGKVYNAKIRLKGLMKGHWQDPIKWSFKVKLKEGRIFGLKKFGMMNPVQRGCINEWIFHQFNYELNNKYLKYEFIELSINDMFLGNYALEEAFDTSKDFLKNEDVILKFKLDEYYNKLRFDSLPDCIEKYDYLHIPECLYEKLEIVSYGNPDSLEFNLAANLLSDFRFGKLKTHQVFDIKKLANYLSVTTIMGNQHPLYLHNVRILFNSKTKLLELIPYDLERYHLLSDKEDYEKFLPWKESRFMNKFLKQMISDSVFKKEYIKVLSNVVNSNLIELFFEKHRKEVSTIRKKLSSNCVELKIKLEDAMLLNKTFIKNNLFSK